MKKIHFMKKKKTHGGKRKGAGRKATEEKISITFRLNKGAVKRAKEKHGKKLNEHVNEWIKQDNPDQK